ncbi:MAG: hypothetical protein ABR549_00145 [Mycobacteriales bacterium]
MTRNQSKPEPFPASATDSEAQTPSTDHPQAPSGTTPARGGSVGDSASVPANSEESAAGSSEEAPVVQGVHTPDVEEPDPRSTGR